MRPVFLFSSILTSDCPFIDRSCEDCVSGEKECGEFDKCLNCGKEKRTMRRLPIMQTPSPAIWWRRRRRPAPPPPPPGTRTPPPGPAPLQPPPKHHLNSARGLSKGTCAQRPHPYGQCPVSSKGRNCIA